MRKIARFAGRLRPAWTLRALALGALLAVTLAAAAWAENYKY